MGFMFVCVCVYAADEFLVVEWMGGERAVRGLRALCRSASCISRFLGRTLAVVVLNVAVNFLRFSLPRVCYIYTGILYICTYISIYYNIMYYVVCSKVRPKYNMQTNANNSGWQQQHRICVSLRQEIIHEWDPK